MATKKTIHMIQENWGNVHCMEWNEIYTPKQLESIREMDAKYPTGFSSLKDKLCLYAEINDKHPLFKSTEEDNYNDFYFGFEWHCGATFSNWKYKQDGSVLSKIVGCDYMHLHDEMVDLSDVMRDMEHLLSYMNEAAIVKKELSV